ncbi:MAG: hypothetical protein U0228_27450 [Myxococcaceae bacterium]
MRELLTPALAATNPKAYIAHFKRLEGTVRQHYLSKLSPEELKVHFKTVGENATVGLFLTAKAGETSFEATVAGSRLGTGGTDEASSLQSRAIELGKQIEAKVVSGLLTTTLGDIERLEPLLQQLGWSIKTVIFAGDSGGGDCAPSLGWSVRGAIRAPGGEESGTFYMPTEALRWEEREVIEPMLRALASRCGATLDVRVG